MKKILTTNPNNWSALITSVALGIPIFPHCAQKLLRWWGGYGFTGIMGFLTGQVERHELLPEMIGSPQNRQPT